MWVLLTRHKIEIDTDAYGRRFRMDGLLFFLFVLHAVALGGMEAEKKKQGILCRYDYYVFPTSHVVCLVRFHLFFFPYSGLYPPCARMR